MSKTNTTFSTDFVTLDLDSMESVSGGRGWGEWIGGQAGSILGGVAGGAGGAAIASESGPVVAAVAANAGRQIGSQAGHYVGAHAGRFVDKTFHRWGKPRHVNVDDDGYTGVAGP
jgi:hypothetical protein